jgi:hypothetical protein
MPTDLLDLLRAAWAVQRLLAARAWSNLRTR